MYIKLKILYYFIKLLLKSKKVILYILIYCIKLINNIKNYIFKKIKKNYIWLKTYY